MIAVSFRCVTGLPIDDCLFVLQSAIPGLSRTALYRCLRRHGVSRRVVSPKAESTPGCFDLYHVTDDDAGSPGFSVAIELASKAIFVIPHQTGPIQTVRAIRKVLLNSTPDTIVAVREIVHDAVPAVSSPLAALLSGEGIVCASERRAWFSECIKRLRDSAGDDLSASIAQAARFISDYNERCRIKALGGLTPFEALRRSARTAAARTTKNGARDVLVPIRRDDDTRERILTSARALLASAGPEGLSLSSVARLAQVSRGSIYQHFGSRPQLIAAVTEWSSRQLTAAVFGDGARGGSSRGEFGLEVISALANFAIRNPIMGQAWLMQILSSANPARDEFWREYLKRSQQFHELPMAEDGIDAEVLSVILLAGSMLWPVWVKSKYDSASEVETYVRRFVREVTRLAMHGTVKSEFYPEISSDLSLSGEAEPASAPKR